MSDHDQNQGESTLPSVAPVEGEINNESPKAKRPYQKPSFISSRAFERQALSCAGCINQASGWPTYCSNQSG